MTAKAPQPGRRFVTGAVLLCFASAPTMIVGCNILNPCTKKSEVVEVEYGSVFYGFDTLMLNTHRRTGWDCRDDGALRDAFGHVIGARYVCTKCD